MAGLSADNLEVSVAGATDSPGHSIVAEIAREIVRVHAQYYGRGPTKAKAVYRNDVIVVVLEEVFTKAEKVLTDGGEFMQVRAQRQAFQDLMAPLLCNVVEQATGRPVRAFLSQVHEQGIASEVFVLASR